MLAQVILDFMASWGVPCTVHALCNHFTSHVQLNVPMP